PTPCSENHGYLGRHVRLQLSRMEGDLLPGEDRGREHAALLRATLPDGRDQLHLLTDAQSEDASELGSANPASLQADAEGAEAHHARCEAQGLRRSAPLLYGDCGEARAEARRAALSAFAELQEEPGSVRCVSRMPTRRRMRRVRISTRLLALRRGLRAAESAQPRALYRRQRELLDAPRDHGELRV